MHEDTYNKNPVLLKGRFIESIWLPEYKLNLQQRKTFWEVTPLCQRLLRSPGTSCAVDMLTRHQAHRLFVEKKHPWVSSPPPAIKANPLTCSFSHTWVSGFPFLLCRHLCFYFSPCLAPYFFLAYLEVFPCSLKGRLWGLFTNSIHTYIFLGPNAPHTVFLGLKLDTVTTFVDKLLCVRCHAGLCREHKCIRSPLLGSSREREEGLWALGEYQGSFHEGRATWGGPWKMSRTLTGKHG